MLDEFYLSPSTTVTPAPASEFSSWSAGRIIHIGQLRWPMYYNGSCKGASATHCCDFKARQHSPKGLPKATKEFEEISLSNGRLQHCHCTVDFTSLGTSANISVGRGS